MFCYNLLKDIINRLCNQWYEKRCEQRKSRQNINVCIAEDNLEEEL